MQTYRASCCFIFLYCLKIRYMIFMTTISCISCDISIHTLSISSVEDDMPTVCQSVVNFHWYHVPHVYYLFFFIRTTKFIYWLHIMHNFDMILTIYAVISTATSHMNVCICMCIACHPTFFYITTISTPRKKATYILNMKYIQTYRYIYRYIYLGHSVSHANKPPMTLPASNYHMIIIWCAIWSVTTNQLTNLDNQPSLFYRWYIPIIVGYSLIHSH